MTAPAERLPRDVYVLGLVSFLTDLSSEAIFSVFSVWLATVLGASALLVGLAEGLADLASCSLDMLSGHLSDRTGRRKPFALAGYSLSTLAKALLLLATGATHAVLFRVGERLGKSIRGAPRDALLAAATPSARRGLAFGLHKSLDKAGAVLGPLAAFYVLDRLGSNAEGFRAIFWLSLAPAALAVLALALLVREADAPPRPDASLVLSLESLGRPYRRFLAVSGFFALSYFSFSFLLLSASNAGFEVKECALLYALLNAASVVASTPAGWLADRLGRRRVVSFGWLVWAGTATGFALATSKPAIVVLFALFGVFAAIDEAQTKAYVADLAPKESRGTAIGVTSLVSGALYLPASILAGALWKLHSPAAAFAVAASIALVASVALLLSPDAEVPSS